MSVDDSTSDGSIPVEADAGEAKSVRQSLETLPLTEEALLAQADKTMPPRWLVLSGRPQTTPTPPTFLRAKTQVGSAINPMEYGRKQSAFHKDNVSKHKLANAADVMNWKKALSGRCGVADRWNKSVLPPDVLCVKRSRENMAHDRGNTYQYNFRAEVLPPKNPPHVVQASKFAVTNVSPEMAQQVTTAKAGSRLLSGHYKRTEEMPINPKLEGMPIWRPESRATRQEERALLAAQSAGARAASARGMRSLTANGTRTGFYQSPEARHKEFVSQVRTLKSAGLTEGYVAMLEAKAAIPHHNRLAKEQSAKERVFSHSGTYAYSKSEDAWMWSDTGSFDQHGPGDIAKVRDPMALNFASTNSA